MDGLGPSIHHLSRQIHRISLVDRQTSTPEKTALQGIESCPLVPPRRDSPCRIRGHRRVSYDHALLQLRKTTHPRQAWRISPSLDHDSLDPTSKRGCHGSPRHDLCGRRSRRREADNRQRETITSTQRKTVQNPGRDERSGPRRGHLRPTIARRDPSEDGWETSQSILELGICYDDRWDRSGPYGSRTWRRGF